MFFFPLQSESVVNKKEEERKKKMVDPEHLPAWKLIAQRLDPRSICRLARTCRNLREVSQLDDVWLGAFESVVGCGDTPGEAVARVPESWISAHSTWVERVKALSVQIPELLRNPPRPSVFAFGAWLVVFPPTEIATEEGDRKVLSERTFVVSRDGQTEVESPNSSNGWFNMRDGDDRDWTVWTRGNKSRDKVNRLFSEFALEKCSGKELPLVPGISIGWGGSKPWNEGDHGHGLQVTATELTIFLPAPAPADRIVFQRDDSVATFKGTRLRDLSI